MKQLKQWNEWAWDAWCIASIIGIWPRYIEPRLLKTTHLRLTIPILSENLNGLKILQLSDLHWHSQFSLTFANKIIKKVRDLKPDLIVFTGDFLCRSVLESALKLQCFLQSFDAPLGCFAILGNHDYKQFVTINQYGEYDVENLCTQSTVSKGFKKLFRSTVLKDQVTQKAKQVPLHQPLIDLIKHTRFQLLHNQTQLISYRQSHLNVCGLGEYSLGRLNPQQAFLNYQIAYPGIILSHHPDTVTVLKNYPGDLILAGHTHGGQVNLPGMWQKFTSIKNQEFKSGLKRLNEKWIYINRGLAGVMPFRWFASPEITLITLQSGKK